MCSFTLLFAAFAARQPACIGAAGHGFLAGKPNVPVPASDILPPTFAGQLNATLQASNCSRVTAGESLTSPDLLLSFYAFDEQFVPSRPIDFDSAWLPLLGPLL